MSQKKIQLSNYCEHQKKLREGYAELKQTILSKRKELPLVDIIDEPI